MSIAPGHRLTPVEPHHTALDRFIDRLGGWVVALLTTSPTPRNGGQR